MCPAIWVDNLGGEVQMDSGPCSCCLLVSYPHSLCDETGYAAESSRLVSIGGYGLEGHPPLAQEAGALPSRLQDTRR